MALAFVLFGLTATHSVHVVHIVVLALLLGVVNAVDMPTRQAFVVEMVGREEIGNAVALNSAVFNGARVVGPAVAGLTIAATDISVAFLVNGLSFLAVLASYRAMDVRRLASPPLLARPASVRAVMADMAEGLRYVRTTPLVLLPILVIGLVATFGMNFSVVIPALARDVLHVGAEGFGFLMAATGLAELALAASGSFGVSLVAMFVVGLGGIGMAATGNTTIQLTVPDHLRGRVMSVYTTVFAGSTPVGGLVTGVLASAVSVPFAIAFGGVGSLVVGLAGFAWYRRMSRGAKDPGIGDAPAEAVSAATVPEVPAGPLLSAPARAGTAAGGAPEVARRSTARG
jgi:MFS family permease